MTEPLALRYRPRTFRDMSGQLPVQTVLHYMIHEMVPAGEPTKAREVPTVPPGLLFSGPRGTGKTSAARILAAALNCASPGRRPCMACQSCESVAAGAASYVTELDAASHGLVSDIRQLTDMVSYDSGAPYRVVILDEAHAMSREGFNALLKTLEEPPGRTEFVLVTTEHGKILPTVASRCMPFAFRRITSEAIRQRLEFICKDAQLPYVDPELLGAIADRADGALRDAVIQLEQAVLAGISTMAHFQTLNGESDYAPSLLASCAMGDHKKLFGEAARVLAQCGDAGVVTGQLVRCLRDELVLHAGGLPAAQGAPLEHRRRLAALVGAPQATAALRVLWELQGLITRSSDPEALLDAALVMCSEAMRSDRTKQDQSRPPGTAVPSGNGRLSAAQARSLAAAPGPA